MAYNGGASVSSSQGIGIIKRRKANGGKQETYQRSAKMGYMNKGYKKSGVNSNKGMGNKKSKMSC